MLNFIGTFDLLVLKHKIHNINYFTKHKTTLDTLKDFMILKSITVIEHNHFLIGYAILLVNPISQCYDKIRTQDKC